MIYALVINKNHNEDNFNGFDDSDIRVDKYLYGKSLNQDILQQISPSDTLVVADIEVIGKELSEIIKTINLVAQYNINLHLIRENLFFKADRLPEIASSLLIAFRLHQSLISLRSSKALQAKKAEGVKLGRPYGFNPDLKLDDKKDEIKKLLLAGVSKDKIAEKYNVCRATVYNFVKKNPRLLSEEVL